MKVESYAPEGFIALDNSALIYPPTEARFNANTYRVSIDLTITVDPAILELAVNDVMQRCSYAKVSLHKGFFWYFLSPNPRPILLQEEGAYPCTRFSFKDGNGYLFKVLYSKNRIALECFHALTDGSGALIYLKMIVQQYYTLASLKEFTFKGALDFQVRPSRQEFSDPFQHLYDKNLPGSPSTGSSFHRIGKGSYDDRVKVISCLVDADLLHSISKKNGVSITGYLCSILLWSLQALQKEEIPMQKKRKPIRISVPMNLRKIFNYETMRNFTLFATPGIEPALGEYTFDEILRNVRHGMETSQDTKKILSQIKRNVGGERNILMRMAPNVIKNPLFKLLSDSLGDDLYSAVLSNLGYVQVPEELQPTLDRMDFYLSPGEMNKVALAVIGWKDTITLNFSSFYNSDTKLERLFCTFLVEAGIPVKISTNRSDSEEL
ncbi:hypothetical protein [uncultured Sphaerochaeta sp.]|uniref:hypothetical protein n=1 Tax=uncultured Sphaerochaeta sp. TaxID=886478 RepID=UPI002A0A1440|nr:hypothetical protein [uncultured Sphaerochaeta sp.]